MRPVKFVFAAVALSMILAAVFVVRARQSPSAQEIIAKMKKTYATCRTYRDTGKSTTDVEKNGLASPKPFRAIENFTTAFVRPDKLRIETSSRSKPSGSNKTSEEDKSIFWRSGNESRFPRLLVGDEEAPFASSLTAYGVKAAIIAPFLLPEEFKGQETDITKAAQRVFATTTEGEDCYGLDVKEIDTQASRISDIQRTLFISKKTFLLRKMISIIKVPSSKSTITFHTEVIWNPAINEVIPDSALEYNSPR